MFRNRKQAVSRLKAQCRCKTRRVQRLTSRRHSKIGMQYSHVHNQFQCVRNILLLASCLQLRKKAPIKVMYTIVFGFTNYCSCAPSHNRTQILHVLVAYRLKMQLLSVGCSSEIEGFVMLFHVELLEGGACGDGAFEVVAIFAADSLLVASGTANCPGFASFLLPLLVFFLPITFFVAFATESFTPTSLCLTLPVA